jgi:CRP-like cAMP-binding protein
MLNNQILNALPATVINRWQGELEDVALKRGDMLYQAGSKMQYGYFPVTGVISILSDLEDGSSAEVAVIGSEGVIGASIYMGDALTSHSAVVLSPGKGYRLKASFLKSEFDQSSEVMQVLLFYTQTMIAQMSQTAACNRHHTLNQQLCRLLLMINDRIDGNEVLMTQDLLARTLGVRREGVTEAALLLQKSGLIRYARGHITLLDRDGIEEQSCECYVMHKNQVC